ncbi:MAG TPA: AAA family ATPase [Polyangiaceae bacterium]|nr:AAA family ATPase [Polyangiaceae bacterium]
MPSRHPRARTKPQPRAKRRGSVLSDGNGVVNGPASPEGAGVRSPSPHAPHAPHADVSAAASAALASRSTALVNGTAAVSSSLAPARAMFRVAADDVVVRTDPTVVAETPRESRGLLELVPAVARRALELGLSAREPSFHVFVAAEPEVMIEDDIVRYAARFASARPTPADIVYVHDFDHPEAPRPLVLAPSAGPALVAAMEGLIEQLKEQIPAVVEGEEFKRAQSKLSGELESKNRAVIRDLEVVAKTLGFGVRPVHGGVQTFPILHGKPVSAEQFDMLDDSTKRALTESEDKLTREVDKAANHVRAQSARFESAREAAFRAAASSVIEEAMKEFAKAVEGLGEDLSGWVARVKQALVDDWHDLVEMDEEEEKPPREEKDDPELATRLNRFKVNLLVTHAAGSPAPVIYDTNPTYPALFGYLERRARYGALLTDFTRIRAGSLHKASGGVLVVRAGDLLTDPIIWERVKRVLREQRIGAEDPLGPLGLYATSLRPVPVPIHVRVVLVGSPELYATLLDADPDFASLFRVKVEVDPMIPRVPRTLEALDAYLMAMANERAWGHFDREARAQLLDLATRLAGDREKLALTLSPLEETMAFASALAAARALGEADGPARAADASASSVANPRLRSDGDGEAEHPFRASIAPPAMTVVAAADVRGAWFERRERAGSAERHIREVTLRGEVALDTCGLRVGVVNGLSVFSAGDVEFGQPMRITAVVGIGREGIIDVEREAQLGGSIHTKGVAILRGYLARMFGQERPLSLRAQLAFEQSYGEIDGDSASSSELFAVLSALSDVGIDQGVAVTGSVNQLGEMQAIGGVCAKVEGFFDLCKARGLNGSQGVLVPSANRPHLVLRDDVAQAIALGQFHIYAVDRAAQGIEVLTGLPAGERDASGRFPASSMFGRVERRIIEIAERLRVAEGHVPHEPDGGLEESSGDERTAGSAARRR